MSIVRDNLMKEKYYTPYCGGEDCIIMPRTHFNGEQFQCRSCRWVSNFDDDFIRRYKENWNIR